MYIDKLNQIILKNALQSGRRRFFISDNAGINEEEFADWSKEFVHTSGNPDERNIREIQVSQLDGSIINLLHQKIDELKETSGNRDVSHGGTAAGVTAASAIAALQEAGSKLSRDMIKSSYRAFKEINYFIIELIRQFYDEPRCFRISGHTDENRFADISNNIFLPDTATKNSIIRNPIFDITVTSEKSNPFSTSAQNELAKDLYNLGMFNPQMADQALLCLEMMNFEGKEKIIEKIKENAQKELPVPAVVSSNTKSSSDEGYLVDSYRKNMPGKTILDALKGDKL